MFGPHSKACIAYNCNRLSATTTHENEKPKIFELKSKKTRENRESDGTGTFLTPHVYGQDEIVHDKTSDVMASLEIRSSSSSRRGPGVSVSHRYNPKPLPHRTAPHRTIPHRYRGVLYRTLPCRTAPSRIRTVLHRTFTAPYTAVPCTVPYSITIRYRIQPCTVLHRRYHQLAPQCTSHGARPPTRQSNPSNLP